MNKVYRHTKIIFTIGPATESEQMLEKLICEGVDICRINMAHADHEWTRTITKRVREVSKKVSREIAIMMDVKGPEIRTCPMDEPIQLVEGQRLDISTHAHEYLEDDDGTPVIGVNYPSIVEDVSTGGEIQVDNGLIKLVIVGKTEDRILCKVEIPGKLGSRRHINLPGVKIRLPAITQKDKDDIKVGIECGVDQFALSFVREATDIDILRSYLAEHKSVAKIIAKIEDQSAITNIDEIIQASDGVMIARGDLGIECPFEDLPIIQRETLKSCLVMGKPVIVATHMLESMIDNPVPTRAEVSDVSLAVYDQADCIMLSGETTIGKYPLECVRVFNRIALKMEKNGGAGYAEGRILKGPKTMMLRSAKILAEELGNTPILVFTKTGRLGDILSSLRCKVPVYAFTNKIHVLRHMATTWGIEPFMLDFHDDPEITIQNAFKLLLTRGWISEGSTLVVVTNTLAHGNVIDTMQLRYI